MVHMSFEISRLNRALGRWNRILTSLLFFYFKFVDLAFFLLNFWRKRKIAPPSKDPITLLNATEAARNIRAREITSTGLIEAYIKRLEEVNPVINAIAFRNYEEARELAKRVDEEIGSMSEDELKECEICRPLLGLPFTMKDAISKKGLVVTCGIYSRKDTVTNVTANVVQRMLDAGAILLATTTVPEMCLWVETSTTLFGRTCNAYDSRRNTGGSSGGEGAVQGAGASLMGIGSDIGGSIRIPSFCNGIFGFVSTSFTVSNKDHVPSAQGSYKDEMLRIGPMTRFSEDLPLLMKVLSQKVPQGVENFKPVKKMRVFYMEGMNHCNIMEPVSDESRENLRMIVSHFEKKFDVSAELASLPEAKYAIEMWFTSFKDPGDPTISQIMQNGLDGFSGPTTPLQSKNCWIELLKSIFGVSEHTFVTIMGGLLDRDNFVSPEERKQINQLRDQARTKLIDLLGDDGILIIPGYPRVAHFHNELVFKQTTLAHTALFNAIALPAVSCPTGLNSEGVPDGVMIIGAPKSDALLISAAQEVSSGFGGWTAPGSM